MCSLESEFESQMGEFHVKMKGKLRLSPASSWLHSACVSSSQFSRLRFQAWPVSHVYVQVTSMR